MNLCVGYQLPDRKTLSDTWLSNEVARITVDVEGILKKQENLSLVPESHQFEATLREEIKKELIVGGGLKSSVKTRWSTAWDCCTLVLCLEIIFKNMLIADSKAMNQTLRNLVNNRNFWLNVESLATILEPAKNAVKSIEGCKQSNHYLQELALYILSIVPHSASCERVFSVLNWFTQKRRSSGKSIQYMARLHSFYILNAQQELNYVGKNLSDDAFSEIMQGYTNSLTSDSDMFINEIENDNDYFENLVSED
ncbi:hypothetical protein RhiirC2_867912 [Rhizophagus irregularis]|uniref:HAT C-terminal dimerisation domain-containing protein n=1 Tax=Rhizophagus irregularis TaxID=588596 RepID=A0A2N1MZZ0_9GLOM|nr:hypothetical protein RhiirC2_867912 [Rhizophagus irregularis]